jgi:hypothetical protein
LSTVHIADGRFGEVRKFKYSDQAVALYEYCAEARTSKDIARCFGSAPWIETAMSEFLKYDLVMHLDNRYLSLALPENPDFNPPDIEDYQAETAEPPPEHSNELVHIA